MILAGSNNGRKSLLPTRSIARLAAEVRIISLRLNVDNGAVAALFALLSDAEREKAARFRFERDRRNFIVARGRLRELLGAALDVDPASVEIEYGPYGKPFLGGVFASSKLHFNVSHSRDLAIVGIARSHVIGVDVEALHPLENADGIAQQFFSRRENQEYSAVCASDKAAAFFNCWTRKEALVKALGQGLSYPLGDFDVSLAPGQPACLHRLGNKLGVDCGWHLQSFSPAPGFTGALAVEGQVASDVCFDDINR